MTTAILEITPQGHYTYVESIAKIYTAKGDDKVIIFTHEKGQKALQHIESQQISIIIKKEDEHYTTFLNGINKTNPDKLYIVTLEPYAKEPYVIAQAFLQTNFKMPIFYVIHNIDFWFQQDPLSKIRNIFYKLSSLNDLIYRCKIYFKYAFILPEIVKKVRDSGGKFAVLSEPVAEELKKYIPTEGVVVVPFSIFNDSMQDNSVENIRLRVCLPGYVSAVRRDYFNVLHIIKNDKTGLIKKNIEWDFLGGISHAEGGLDIINMLKSLVAMGHIIHFYEKPSVGIVEFDENLSKADIVLGNLHIRQGASGAYGKSKESGLVFTMIKAAKPGIVPCEYVVEKAMQSSILKFKNYEQLSEILIHLAQNPSKLKQLKEEARKNAMHYTPLSIFNKIEVKVQSIEYRV
jgi:hypothetical protein